MLIDDIKIYFNEMNYTTFKRILMSLFFHKKPFNGYYQKIPYTNSFLIVISAFYISKIVRNKIYMNILSHFTKLNIFLRNILYKILYLRSTNFYNF